ncbi:hypothetical protein INF28_04635 [Oscillospiraceae bacterium DSM 107454]|uniref:Uncharacterized protein n=1 Tax=Ructibacterium gallinarum TaxID=2779355 RepID=A0A9D5RB75_9FIRM|nr:hypothetical protein [Ructibacterium gallinarum]
MQTLYSSDKDVIDRELEAKILILKEGYRYILHSDHSILENVTYDTYRYCMDRAMELGQY